MKKTLSEIKSALMEKYTDSEVVFGKYMDKVFELFEDEFQVSEAFYYFNKDKRVSINKNKQNRKRVAADEAHIATQFFTPKWLVQYVSDNSLGRFLKGAPLRFFHGDTNTIRQKDDIKILDPAVGTGNMLIYAYELLENYYRTKGMAEDKIPPKILSCFYGLDIDKKAVDVAKRLLMRKAGVEKFDFHIYHFESVSPILLQKVRDLKLKKLLGLFEHWNKYKEAGSLIKIEEDLTKELKLLKKHIHSSEEKNIIEIINILSQKYDVTLMNPPYLSSSDFSFNLKEYIYQNYNDYKADLFSCFIKRGLKLMKENGYMGVVCPYNWMFIKTFSQLRKYIIENKGLYNLMQLNCGGYDKAVVYLSAFVVGDKKPTDGYYIRLSDFKAKNQKEMALRAIDNPPYVYKKNQDVFLKTPNYAIIYWTSESFLNNFHYKKLSDYLEIRQGMATGDNKRFLSKVEKVDKNKICFHAKSLEDFDKSNKIYAPYNKGGKYRKWWGNRDYVIKFDKASREVLSCQGNRMPSKKFYFKECITWTLVSSKGHFGARYSNNSVFDVGGSCAFLKEGTKISIHVFLAFLCSKVATYYLNALNPTLNAQVGDIKNLPFIEPDFKIAEEITKLAKENIEISRLDWYNKGKTSDFIKIKQNEQRINQIFIELYALQEELDYQSDDKLITLKGEKHEK